MIPFALKQVWFWLALVGLVQCWGLFVFIPRRRYGGLWGRLYYCTFLTILEGVFCLGMIWRMDPRRMPHNFCVAQVALISLGSFGLTGVCASFSVANALAVFRPNSFDSGRAILAWNSRYVPLVVAFPIIASAVHSSLLVTLDPVNPSLSDDLHCDATKPVWMRLVGYAGVPLVVSIPFLVLSCYTAVRFFKISRTGFSETFSTLDAADAFESATPTQSYEQHENRRRAHAFRLTAFLPYPSLFSKSTGAVHESMPASASASGIAAPDSPTYPTQTEYPLHEHPFPPIDPRTGKAFSPSLDGHDGASITIAEPGVVHMREWARPADSARDLSMTRLDGRPEGSTPDSTYSGSMPVFAQNPLFRGRSPATTDRSRRTSTPLRSVEEGGDTQIGLAITTDDITTVSQVEDVSSCVGRQESEEHVTGFAVTTDEPDARTPSPQGSDTNSSQELSEVHTLHELQRAQDALARSEQSSGERMRSSMSTTRTLITSPQYALFRDRLADLAHSASSSPHHVPGHQRQSSLVSSATVFSPISPPLPDHEVRELPFSATSAAGSLRSPITPQKEHGGGIDVLLDLLPHPSSKIHRREHADLPHDGGSSQGHGQHEPVHELDQKGQKWEWDDVDDHATMDVDADTGVTRTVEPRDPYKRLGIYNPTPPTATVSVLQRRRQKMQRKREQAENSSRKLWGAIWKLVLFQIAFFSVQLLAALSPIMDSIRGTVTPFGTQHVALLLAAWGPLFIFCIIPNTLHFWTRWL